MATPMESLANILSRRKRSAAKPYNLLLTSTISLTPTVLADVVGSDNWSAFSEHVRSMGRHDRLYLLKEQLEKTEEMLGYKALAKLLIAGYFSTVLTTNVDSFLENALFEQNVPSSAYETLVLDRDQDGRIANALEREPDTIRIVKLRGSLSDEVISETFPEIFELRSTIRTGLERYLNQDIVIVGSLQREDDLRRSLSTRGGSIYYAVPDPPQANDEVLKTLNARRQNPAIQVITGSNGDFSTFLQSLVTILLEKTPALENSGTFVRNPPHVQTRSSPVTPAQISNQTVLSVSQIVEPLQEAREEPTLSAIEKDRRQVQESLTASGQTEEKMQAQAAVETEKKQTTLRSTITLISVLVGIVVLLAASALVQRFATLSDLLLIIPLLIVISTIVLVTVGIINSKQFTQIISQAQGTKSSDTKSESDEQTSEDKAE